MLTCRHNFLWKQSNFEKQRILYKTDNTDKKETSKQNKGFFESLKYKM